MPAMMVRVTQLGLRNLMVILLVQVAGSNLWAQNGIAAVKTDPIWTTNVFWTNPPVVASDSNLVNQVQLTQEHCFAGSSSTDDNCYYSTMSGNFTILNESATQSFAGLILQPTFSSAVSVNGSMGRVNFNTSEFTTAPGLIGNGSAASSASSLNGNGDPSYIFLRLSDYFSGVNCAANANQTNCVLVPGQPVSVPYSFVTLPANVIFSISAVGADQTIYDMTSNTSTSNILEALGNGGVSSTSPSGAPEPGTLLLCSGGILPLLCALLWKRRGSAGLNHRI
jgi:hypothetical protein